MTAVVTALVLDAFLFGHHFTSIADAGNVPLTVVAGVLLALIVWMILEGGAAVWARKRTTAR